MQLSPYQTLFDLSQRMLDHAHQQEWDQLIELSQSYLAAVEQLKTLAAPSEAEAPAQHQLLSRIVENDSKIRELVAPELQRLGHLLGDIKRQQNVVQAYCAPSMNP